MTVNQPNMFSGIPVERSDGTISVLCTLPQMADALATAGHPMGQCFWLRWLPWWGKGWDVAARDVHRAFIAAAVEADCLPDSYMKKK
jgi:hypothetical protein